MSLKERIFLISIVFIFILILLRLWQLQILNSEKYKKLSEQNRVKIIKTQAPRGIIYDRNGIPLVENVTSFSLSVSAEYAEKIDVGILSKILNISVEELRKKLSKKTESIYLPIKIKENLSFKEVVMLEARKSQLPGIIIEINMKRYYPLGAATAHLLGYLGKITEEQIKKPDYQNIPSYFMVGQSGIEKLFDIQLRGIFGEKVIEVDALGREIRLLREIQPFKGEDIYLTIDYFLQQAAYEALKDLTAAFVAIKVDTGEILAMVSTPAFDPNRFVEGVEDDYWRGLINNPEKPMINRTIQGLYPPGSIFKIVTAVAGLEEGVINPEKILVNCSGEISFGKWSFGCWRKEGHGAVDLKRALVESCDIYFYELGKILGIKNIYRYAKLLGLGSQTGLFSEEKSGLVPNEEWKKNTKNLPWYLGDTFNTAIGQGFLRVTPLQIASLIATVVNGGVRITPYIVKDQQPKKLNLNLNSENLEIIKKALAAVVNEPNGTAWTARSNLIKFSGKTGTVQVVSKKIKEKYKRKAFEHHAWFAGFAPLDKPEIAFAIIVEHGGGGGAVAAPKVREILERYIIKKRELYVKDR